MYIKVRVGGAGALSHSLEYDLHAFIRCCGSRWMYYIIMWYSQRVRCKNSMLTDSRANRAHMLNSESVFGFLYFMPFFFSYGHFNMPGGFI